MLRWFESTRAHQKPRAFPSGRARGFLFSRRVCLLPAAHHARGRKARARPVCTICRNYVYFQRTGKQGFPFWRGRPCFFVCAGQNAEKPFLSNIPCRYDDFLQEKAQNWIQDEKCCLFAQKGFAKLVNDYHGACYTNAV